MFGKVNKFFFCGVTITMFVCSGCFTSRVLKIVREGDPPPDYKDVSYYIGTVDEKVFKNNTNFYLTPATIYACSEVEENQRIKIIVESVTPQRNTQGKPISAITGRLMNLDRHPFLLYVDISAAAIKPGDNLFYFTIDNPYVEKRYINASYFDNNSELAPPQPIKIEPPKKDTVKTPLIVKIETPKPEPVKIDTPKVIAKIEPKITINPEPAKSEEEYVTTTTKKITRKKKSSRNNSNSSSETKTAAPKKKVQSTAPTVKKKSTSPPVKKPANVVKKPAVSSGNKNSSDDIEEYEEIITTVGTRKKK